MKRKGIVALAVGVVMMVAAGEKKNETPEALLGAAIHQQEAEGNLEAAIEGYKKFLAQYASHRPLAAKAQFRLAVCYEKLGNPEARKAYERVIADHADQAELVAQARSRLAALAPRGSSRPEVVSRRLFAMSGTGWIGSTSPDERFVTYVRRTGPGRPGLVLREIATGQERLLTDLGNVFIAVAIPFSPDSKILAFKTVTAGSSQLRLVNIEGTGHHVLFQNPRSHPAYRRTGRRTANTSWQCSPEETSRDNLPWSPPSTARCGC